MSDEAKGVKEYSLEEVRAAKPEAKKVFARLGDLAGIGITRFGSGYGLKVNLGSSPKQELPTDFNGIPVRTEIVGKIVKQS